MYTGQFVDATSFIGIEIKKQKPSKNCCRGEQK